MSENLPSDVAAERAVLAGVCTYGSDAYTDVGDLVTTRAFTDPTHQTIWACASRVIGDDPAAKLDYPTILSAAKGLGVAEAFSKPEDMSVLRAVLNLPVRLESTRKLAAKLRKLEFARDALGVLDGVRDSVSKVTGDEPVESIVTQIENPVLDISSLLTAASGNGPQAVGAGLRAYAQHLADNQRDIVGVPSGFRLYDTAIGGGFRPGTVNVIGARPKIGKSLLATNIAVRVASGSGYTQYFVQGDRNILNAVEVNHPPAAPVPVLQLDTEMTREDQWLRQLACVSGVQIADIETGKYANDPYKSQLVSRAIDRLESWPYDFLSIAGQAFDETESTMRRWVTKRVGFNDDGSAKPCLIVFDYLKLMDSESMESKNLAEFQVLGFMMTRLHNFAVKYKVPILTFIQLNRDGINVEDTSAASGSDRIVWLCSNFSIYKKKTDEEIAEQAGSKQVWNRKLVPIVARHGAGLEDGDYVNMMSHGAVARIDEGPTRDGAGADRDGSRPTGIIIEDTSDQDEVPFAAA